MILGLLKECIRQARSAIIDAIDLGNDRAFARINTDSGYIDVVVNRYGSHVDICHDNESMRDCPNLCKVIADALPTWDSVENELEAEEAESEYERNGYVNEEAYWRERINL